jgi:3-phenylpropionate/cinnamic acid dioxygenase small subunit
LRLTLVAPSATVTLGGMIDALDIVMIHQLLGRYGHTVDAGDWDAFAALFVEDASIDYRSSSGLVERSGREAIVAWFRGVPHPGAHHVTNIVVDEHPDREGRVHVHSKFFAPYTREEHVPKRVYGGDYHDLVVRTEDGWRFVWKQCIPRWNLAVVADDTAPPNRLTF